MVLQVDLVLAQPTQEALEAAQPLLIHSVGAHLVLIPEVRRNFSVFLSPRCSDCISHLPFFR